MQEKHKLSIEFDSKEAAEHFSDWLCGQGEQDYWLWMECREQEEDGNITATSFHYRNKNGLITTTCGRLDGSSK